MGQALVVPGSDIRVAHTGAPGVAYTYYPLHYNDSSGGDVWLPSSSLAGPPSW
jgi:hypothetical protein